MSDTRHQGAPDTAFGTGAHPWQGVLRGLAYALLIGGAAWLAYTGGRLLSAPLTDAMVDTLRYATSTVVAGLLLAALADWTTDSRGGDHPAQSEANSVTTDPLER